MSTFSRLAALCVLLAACGDRSGPTEAASPLHPELRTDQSGDGPGAEVVRIDGSTIAFRFPEFFGRTVTVGFTLDAVAAFCASEPFVGEPSGVQRVLRPDGSVTDLTKALDATIMVYPTNDICADLPVAIGDGKFISTDNDGFVSLNRGNSFGFQVVGQVTDASGDRHHVSGAFHGVIGRDAVVRLERYGFLVR